MVSKVYNILVCVYKEHFFLEIVKDLMDCLVCVFIVIFCVFILSVQLSVSLSVCLSIQFTLYINLSILVTNYLCIYQHVSVSIYVSLNNLLVHRFINLSVKKNLSICLSIYLTSTSTYLSAPQKVLKYSPKLVHLWAHTCRIR